MFNVELPPDSSWKWSTGITTEDQNEINRLESRVRETEEDLKLRAKSYDANSKGWQKDIAAAKERIKVLEDAATLAVDWMRAHADISGVSIYHKLKAALAEVK